MKGISSVKSIISVSCFSLLLAPALSQADSVCDNESYRVKGKIVNNAQAGESPYSTLGVVSMRGDFGKMKCGIVGVVKEELPPPSLPNFEHVISCNDEVVLPDGSIIHSQLSFDTNGMFTDPYVHPLPFVEQAVPLAGTGRGVFTGATGGVLNIEGTINTVTGTIDMKFRGEICMTQPG